MTSVLILGVSGMLGSMVFDYLAKNTDLSVYGTVRNPEFLTSNVFLFDAYDITQLENKEFVDLNPDYIVNCIGITKPFSRDDDPEGVKRAITINSEFPWKLSDYTKKYNIKVIQIGTDCVYSGKKGLYSELDQHDPLDVYGKSKSLGEVFDGSSLIIRCSIIGPEFKKQHSFLLEWFLNQPQGGTIGGYEHHLWNGITTLQFAQLCEKIITSNLYDKLIEKSTVHHYTPNNIVNKYELMNIFNDVFKKELKVNRVNKPDEKVDRTLTSEYTSLNAYFKKTDMKSAIRDLKNYMDI
ncbi:MAG: dTDP-4-dehydrorhamnose reductase family protein [Candidatus Hermodarchaeota archaeon]